MKTSKRKTVLIVFGIIIAFILELAVIFHFGPYLIARLLFGPSEVSAEERFVEFDDGSVLERTGGPTYEHKLADKFIFDRCDTTFECNIYTQPEHTDITEEYPYNRVFKYSFSPEGYIAYRILSKQYTPETDEPVLYEFKGYNILSDKNVLYNSNTDTRIEFDSMNKLIDYCDENDIELGDWYYPVGRSTVPEFDFVETDNWDLRISGADWYQTVYHNDRMMFAGTIDKFFVSDRYFAFHFVLREGYEYEIEENPVIEFNPDIVIGKKLFADIYSDSYVFIDTETDKYEIFEDKSSVKEYAESLGVRLKWEKVKYDD
ncbi:MAG: hypothetical protein IKW03_01790 [Clostridia bacterium]|nr:hypothetical protein [Clostridia bacterium]